jgi:IMP dehydrogenase
LSIEEQLTQVQQVKLEKLLVGAAIGTDSHSQKRVHALVGAEVDVIVIDTAHGHSQAVLDMVAWIKKEYEFVRVIAGNIVTGDAARALANVGADAVKVGIGPGAACTTRIVTGVGFPQLSAIANVAEALSGTQITIIADGGIRFSGDMSKALAAGAHCVMMGQMLAGTDEAPGNLIDENGTLFKVYRGMHSPGSLALKYGVEDPHFKALAKKLVSEGAEGKVPYRGSLADRVYQLMGGLRSCMGYVGCRTIAELHAKAEFVRITSASMKESHVHDITLTSVAPNYSIQK